MKKNLVMCVSMLLCLTLVLLCGCSSRAAKPAETTAADGCDFSELSKLEFCFASGAGGWSTLVQINEDGTFVGAYHDSEMGVTGEGYPNGTYYICEFTGKLEDYSVVDDNSFALTVKGLSYAPAETESIEDGIRYITAEPYGLSEGCRLVFIREGTDISGISEDMLRWVGVYDNEDNKSVSVDCMIMCNMTDNYAFTSYPAYEPKA